MEPILMPIKTPKGFISPADATPETPAWRIVGTDKSDRFAWGKRVRIIRYGRCTAFDSAEELCAFAEFVEEHPEFILHSGHHQAPVNANTIATLPDGRIRYETVPMNDQPAKTVTARLDSIHNGLWVTQTPWEPIPMEHRDWIKNKPAYLKKKITTNPDNGPNLENESMPANDDSEDTTARNTILYGPPGTGKTYSTILRAVGILDGVAPKTLSMEEAKPRWNALRGEGRIEFVTFHQSYGYEDFIEGIRPVMSDEAGEMPRYEVFDGVLKRIALRALGAMLEATEDTSDTAGNDSSLPLPFSVVWECLAREVKDFQGKGVGPFQVPALRLGSQMEITSITDNGRVKNNSEPSERSFSREALAAVYAKFSRYKTTIAMSDVENIPDAKGHANYIAAVYNYIKSRENEWRQSMVSSEEQQEREDIEETGPVLAAQDYLALGDASGYHLNTANPPHYVLVIDEINRGNISKIFGELITLIEDDKRIGGEVALTVTLPHSRETFGLPANLYILGTMNTADKSIALVDVALRRRFEFEELMPDISEITCPGLSTAMQDVITRLNKRIVMRKDRDHQIGHAFFRSVKTTDDFNRVFAKRVIPLLQEYFYGDWESLRFVLGEAQSNGRFIIPIDGENEPGARNHWQWYHDAGQPLDILQTLLQNYKINE